MFGDELARCFIPLNQAVNGGRVHATLFGDGFYFGIARFTDFPGLWVVVTMAAHDLDEGIEQRAFTGKPFAAEIVVAERSTARVVIETANLVRDRL